MFICINLKEKGLVESKYSKRGPAPDQQFRYFYSVFVFFICFHTLAIHDLGCFNEQNKRDVLMSWIRITAQ